MSEMSVSMILKLVDQVTGPAKEAESSLAHFKKSVEALSDIKKGSAGSWFDAKDFSAAHQQLVKRREDIEALQQTEQRSASAVQAMAQETAAARTNAAAAATAAAGQIVAANEKVVASEQRTLAAIEISAKEQQSAITALQRQRAAAHAQAVRDDHNEQQRQRAAARAQAIKEEREARQNSFGGLASSSVGGFVAGAAGTALSVHAVVHGIRSSIERGAEFQHENVALENAGRSMTELAEMHAAANRVVAAVPTATFSETLKALNETTSAFGSVEHATENLPFVMRTASVLHGAAGDKIGGDAGEMGNLLARFFEERGTAGNSELFQKEANELVRSMVFTRGNFNPREALNFAQQAKSALQNYDIEFLTRVVPTIATTMGGERAGTAANAFKNVIMGKVNDSKQADAWVKYGLVDPDQAVKNNKGQIVGWRAGAVHDTNDALTNPLKFMEHVLAALKAHGVNIDDRMELTKVLDTMFRNPNANMFANELGQPQQVARLKKDAHLIDETKTPDEIYANNLKGDPTVAMTALTASLENLQTVATSPAMAGTAKAISSLASGLQSLAQWGGEHPTKAMEIGGSVAAGGLFGSGYLLYKLSTGFGLSTSATQLSTAATALEAAAGRMGGGLPGGIGAPPGGGKIPGLGWRAMASVFPFAFAALNVPQTPEEFKEQAKKNDENEETARKFFVNHLPSWMVPDDWKAKPQPAPSSQPAPQGGSQSVDGQSIDNAKAKADQAKASLDQLNATVSPNVDVAGLDALIAKITEARRQLSLLNSMAPSGSFSPSSGALHDGPEAR